MIRLNHRISHALSTHQNLVGVISEGHNESRDNHSAAEVSANSLSLSQAGPYATPRLDSPSTPQQKSEAEETLSFLSFFAKFVADT